jgi:hypothetical protein
MRRKDGAVELICLVEMVAIISELTVLNPTYL